MAVNPFRSKVVNQHYIPRCEQRMNATPAGKIIPFEVHPDRRRAAPILRKNDVAIRANLSADDLFSFHVISDTQRLNLETQFGKYEDRVVQSTDAILEKIRCGRECLEDDFKPLFAAKFLNFLRSPLSVDKIMNTLQSVSAYAPAEAELRNEYKKIGSGHLPNLPSILDQFDLTEEKWKTWIRALVMLLTVTDGSKNLFEQSIDDLYGKSVMKVWIYHYSGKSKDEVCLLSDRGFNVVNNDPGEFTIEFNLRSSSFIRFQFLDAEEIVKHVLTNSPHLQSLPAKMPRIRFKVEFERFTFEQHMDQRQILEEYNRRTVDMCSSRVFCAGPEVAGVTVERWKYPGYVAAISRAQVIKYLTSLHPSEFLRVMDDLKDVWDLN